MRIGIDVRYLSHGLMGGVHTYIRHFVPALIEQAAEHSIVLYADTKRPFELTDLPPHVTVRRLPWHHPLSSSFHDLTMHRQMAADRLDVVHFPANYGFGPASARTVITLHDAINILPLGEIWRGHAKNARTLGMMTYLHLCSRAAIRRASIILTVSETAKREIHRRIGGDPARIIAVPHAPTPDLVRVTNSERLSDVRRQYDLPAGFVLADALKNPGVLVAAWQRLPAELRADRRIVFFSRRSDPPAIVSQAVAAGLAQLIVRPSRSDLIALYSLADAFVFPSWIEGFGLPLLEAMACGAPVIASDRGSIPEVTGGAALLADATDERTFAKHLGAILGTPSLAASMRAAGLARAGQFTWQASAQRILQSYGVSGLRPPTDRVEGVADYATR